MIGPSRRVLDPPKVGQNLGNLNFGGSWRPFQKVFWNLEPSNPGAYKPGFYEYAKDRIKKLCLRPSPEGPISQFSQAAAK